MNHYIENFIYMDNNTIIEMTLTVEEITAELRQAKREVRISKIHDRQENVRVLLMDALTTKDDKEACRLASSFIQRFKTLNPVR